METAFNTAAYREAQVNAFSQNIPDARPTIIEFGGKPFGDYHASRVLPGYDPDVKAGIIRDVHSELSRRTIGGTCITIAVHAKDILSPPDSRRPAARIRGDYGITYDAELFRMTGEARQVHRIPIANVAITSTPRKLSPQNEEMIGEFRKKLDQEFDTVRILPEIDDYPYVPQSKVVSELTQAQPIAAIPQSELIVSPGGGSGKFSVAVTELAHKLNQGESPHYIKFETFPVFHMPPRHPLNRAFIAATVDLKNELVELDNGLTNYDKDVGNFSLLQTLLKAFPNVKTPMRFFENPTDMGVNVIETGIRDEVAVAEACRVEVERRIARYTREVDEGKELAITLDRIAEVA